MTEIEWWEYDDAEEMAAAVAGDVYLIAAGLPLKMKG